MTAVLWCDGIGTAPLPDGSPSLILRPVAERLADRVGGHPVRVPWSASMMSVGGPKPWPQASAEAVRFIRHYMEQTPGRVVLLGFSGGCRPVAEFITDHPGLRGRVAAVGLMADPYRPAGRWQAGLPDPGGHGICGQRLGMAADRTYWTSAPGDPISSAAPDSLLRYAASLADVVPGQFVRTFLDHAARGRLQLAPHLGLPLHEWFFGLGPRIDRSMREARAYLGDGHTTAYHRPHAGGLSLADRLADSISWKVRNS